MENTNRFLCHLAWLALANGGHCQEIKECQTMSLGCFFLSLAPCYHHLPESDGLQAVLSSSPSSGGSHDYHSSFHFTPESAITFLSLLASVCSNISPWFCLTLLTAFYIMHSLNSAQWIHWNMPSASFWDSPLCVATGHPFHRMGFLIVSEVSSVAFLLPHM